jgi:hypothetical protein
MDSDSAPTLRHTIEEWLEEEFNDHEEIDIRLIATRGFEYFYADPEFRHQFVQDFLRSTIYTIALGMMTRARHMSLISAEEAANIIAEGSVKKIAKWRERDPQTGTYILLTKLSKEQGLRAAQDRERRAVPNLKRAGFLRLVMGRLEEGEIVEDKWTLEQLAALEEQIEVTTPKYTLAKPRRRGGIMTQIREESTANGPRIHSR